MKSIVPVRRRHAVARIGSLLLFCAALAPASSAQAAAAFTWIQGQPSPVVMTPAGDSVCVLTAMRGKFRGFGEVIHVVRSAGRWQLQGSSQQEGVKAEAQCFSLNQFSGKTSSTVGGETVQQWNGASDGCVSNLADVAPASSAAYISSIGGSFRGGGEFLQVDQSVSTAKTQFTNQTCRQNGEMLAGVTAFFPGKPHAGALPTFEGPGRKVGPANVAGEFVAGPNQTVVMASVNDAMCYFTRLAGAFNGGGEGASIRPMEPNPFSPVGKRWVLTTQSKSGDGVWASARCLRFKQ